MKSAQDIAKAIEKLQKLQATVENIAKEMAAAETLTDVENTNWEARLDKAYLSTQETVENCMDKAYEKMFGILVTLYDQAEETLPVGE